MGEYNLKNTPVWGMLSAYGRRVDFLTHGVLGQTAEARADAYRFNATLGEAREKGGPMYLTSMHRQFSGVSPQEVYPYAHPAGLPRLCALWEEKALRENPAMADKKTGTPVVTAGLTHGLSLVGSLFLDPGDRSCSTTSTGKTMILFLETAAAVKCVSTPPSRRDILIGRDCSSCWRAVGRRPWWF